jgi:hypothetical protein
MYIILAFVLLALGFMLLYSALFPAKHVTEVIHINSKEEFREFLLHEQRSNLFDFRSFIQDLLVEWNEDKIDDYILDDTINELLNPIRSRKKNINRKVYVHMLKSDIAEVIVDEYLKQINR